VLLLLTELIIPTVLVQITTMKLVPSVQSVTINVEIVLIISRIVLLVPILTDHHPLVVDVMQLFMMMELMQLVKLVYIHA